MKTGLARGRERGKVCWKDSRCSSVLAAILRAFRSMLGLFSRGIWNGGMQDFDLFQNLLYINQSMSNQHKIVINHSNKVK